MQAYKLGTVRYESADLAALVVDQRVFGLPSLISASGDEISRAEPGGGSPSVLDILNRWTDWQPRLEALAALVTSDASFAPLPEPVTLRPPVPTASTVLGVGANYRDHLQEMGSEETDGPVFLFLKPAVATQIGSGQPLFAPRHLNWIDWEAELAVIIGRDADHVSVEEARDVVAGYAVANDVSARDAFASAVPGLGVDWLEHKGYQGFTPIGPAMTPAVFVPDPQQLEIELEVNGVLKQSSSTAQMINGVFALIARASAVFSLRPGDVILTGTPAGVGFARSPRESLRPGDVVTVRIQSLGEIQTPIV